MSKKFDIIKTLSKRKDPTESMYGHVANYVKSKGGNVRVIGGIQIQDEGHGRFKVAISCSGKVPKYAERKP